MKAFIKKQFETMQRDPAKFQQMQERMMNSAQGQQRMAQMTGQAPQPQPQQPNPAVQPGPLGMFGAQPQLDPEAQDLNQQCKDGNFKPFIALLATNSDKVDKQHVVEPQLNRQVVHLACHHGDMAALRALNERFQADLSVIDNSKYSAMHYAASSGQVEVLQYLHKYLPEHHLNLPDQCLMPPLVHAVNNSRLLAAIYLLLGLRAETEFEDNTGCSLLHWACYQGNLNIVKVLDHMGVQAIAEAAR